MSSGDLTRNFASPPRVGSGIRTSGSQERLDPAQIPLPSSGTGSSRATENINPTQIPLPPSEAGSARLNEPVTPPPPELTDDADKDRKQYFLEEVARRDPFTQQPKPVNEADEADEADEAEKPTLMESWEKVLKKADKYDEDMVVGWQGDIDILIFFSGIFSAVVTAFTIESYRWLDEDPADTTVALLTQLISVQVNGPQSISAETVQFEPSASTIRINCFWFVSLILSLTSALFGLMCKQWVREHQRDPETRTPEEALALRQLRRDSFDKWGISSFLWSLPVVLEYALLFFFFGVLDLLWNRSRVRSPFFVCLVAVSLSGGSYLLTSLLPTLMVPGGQRDNISRGRFNRLSYQFICPFKSSHAWMVYQLSTTLVRPFLKIRVIDYFLYEKARRFWEHITSPAPDWSAYDLGVVRQFDQRAWTGTKPLTLKVYELGAIEWAVTTFRGSSSMIRHLQNILGTIPPSVAVCAVFGRWDLRLWNTVSVQDVRNLLTDSESLLWTPPNPDIRNPVLRQSERINLLFHYQYWAQLAADPLLHHRDYLDDLLASMKHADLQHSTGLRFVIPFSIVDALWTHEDRGVRRGSLALLSIFEQYWKPYPGYDEERHAGERRTFMKALAKHINRTGRISELLTSKRGQAFIRFIHHEAIARRLFYYPVSLTRWDQAIRRTQEVGDLPSDYFAPIPENPKNPTLPTLEPVRYSIETERDMQVGNDEILDIATSNGTEDGAEAGHTVGGLARRLHNFGAWLASRRWLPFFQRDEQVVHNDVGPSGNIVPEHDSGMDGAGQPTDKQEDHTPGNTNGQGDARVG